FSYRSSRSCRVGRNIKFHKNRLLRQGTSRTKPTNHADSGSTNLICAEEADRPGLALQGVLPENQSLAASQPHDAMRLENRQLESVNLFRYSQYPHVLYLAESTPGGGGGCQGKNSDTRI